MTYFTEFKNRYFNCRIWHGNRTHSFVYAMFRPSHANKNLRRLGRMTK